MITGGYYNEADKHLKTVSVYNKTGFVGNIANLINHRWNHGCTSYVADNKRVNCSCFLLFVLIFYIFFNERHFW